MFTTASNIIDNRSLQSESEWTRDLRDLIKKMSKKERSIYNYTQYNIHM